MARLAQCNRRNFLRAASGLFVPALILGTKADVILSGPIMRTIATAASDTPPVTANLVGWWTARDPAYVTIATGVSQLADRSGAGHHLAQATGANQPSKQTASLNGYDTVLFDGSNDVLVATAFTLNAPETVIMVFKQVSFDAPDRLFSGENTSVGTCIQNTNSPDIALFSGSIVANNSAATIGTWVIGTFKFNGASSSLQINNGTPTTGNPGTANMGGFKLSNGCNLQVAEVLLYSAALSDGDRDSVKTWLSDRWAISL